MEANDAGIVHQAPPAKMAFWKENLLASAVLAASGHAAGMGGFGGGHIGG